VPPLSNAGLRRDLLILRPEFSSSTAGGAAAGSLDDAKLAQFTRDASFKTVVDDVKFGKGGG
jgi:hypothetical protein